MAYTEAQKVAHIKEFQRYLRSISNTDPRIPAIIPSGIFDSETEKAVTAFQSAYGIAPTGAVDRATWDKIIEVYDKRGIEQIDAYPSADHMIDTGDSGYLVLLIQLMLNYIGETYRNLPRPSFNGDYDEPTMNSVKSIQKLSGIPQTGVADLDTWNMIVRLFNVLLPEK